MRYFLQKGRIPCFLVFHFIIAAFTRVEAQITCDFNLTKTVSCSPFLIEATANETSPVGVFQRQWTLTGPGVNQVSPINVNLNFQYVATIPGTYCLKLWSKNLNGDTCSITKCNIVVAANPNIDFTFTPTEGCSPLTIQAVCNSTAGSGVIDSLAIDWGAGGGVYYNTTCPSSPIMKTYTAIPGCISPTVVIKNSFGCYSDSTYFQKICIIPKPVANFTADTTTVNCATGPQTVHFTASNAGPNITYKWYINGSLVQSDTSKFLTYTFPINPVCYDVALKVEHPSAGSCSDSIFKAGYICIRAQPLLTFTQNITNACVKPGSPATLVLTNTSPGLASVNWNLSGGFSSQSGGSATYNITTAGTYNVTVTGTFGAGCSSSISQQVLVVNDKPTALFSVDDTFSCSVPVTVNYTANTCAGCSYAWTFIGGSPTTSTNTVQSVTYNSFGNFNARLIVTSTNGCKDTLSKNSLVKVRKISPQISMSKLKGCAPLCVTFDDITNYSTIPDPIASVCWSFPGSNITGACQDTIKRCFTAVGCYDVKLKVTTTTGCVDSLFLNDTVCVGAPPVCSVTACAGTPPNCTTPGGPPLVMCFEEDSVVYNLSCDSFDFAKVDYGDGIVEVVYAPLFQHFFQDTGLLTTTIIPYNDSCKQDTLRIQVRILPPIALFRDSSACNSDTVFLLNDSKGADSFKWFFCNGDSSVLPNPKVSLPPCDTCSILLKAYNNNGCVHQKYKLINTPCNDASLTPTDTAGCAPITIKFKNTSATKTSSFTRWNFNWGAGPTWSGSNTAGGDSVSKTFNVPGLFTVAMRNKSNSGCIDTVYSTVRICKVTANFSPTNVCLPLPVNFKDLTIDSTCGVNSWLWSFGDGTYSADQNPVHTYTTAGQYTVKLVVQNAYGCRDSITKTVSAAPVNISYTIDTIICPGKQGCITNSSTGAGLTYSWTIPGALPQSVFTTPAPCYSFPSPGDYPAYIRISSAGQCDFYDTVVIHNQYPQVGGYVSTNYIACPNPPQILQFYDSSKYVDSSWLWNFGDNSFSLFDTANHIYSTPGCYGVYLTGTTKDGCSATTYIDSVCVDGPYGDFGFSPPGMCACKDTITFTVSTVNSLNLSLVYGCLQGSATVNPISPIGTAANPTVLSFQVPYCVTDSCQPQLIFGDTAGCQVYIAGNYAYIDSPVVNFTFDNYGVCVNGIVCFQDVTTYTLPPYRSFTVKRVWDFGDGSIDSTSNNPSPCHYYSQPGGYNTKLYITSNYGCFDSVVSTVVVVPEFPIAGFYAEDSLVCANSPICFQDTSWIYPLTGADYWVVDFGDGKIDTFHSKTFCHIYDTGGYYRVTMCVYDSVGCPDCDSSVVVRVIDNPIANAGGDKNVCYGIVTQLNGSGGLSAQWQPAGIFSNPNIYNPTVQLFNDTSVALYVSDQYGCSDTEYAILSISRVFADFNVGTTFCEKVPVCVTDSSTNQNGVSVVWNYDFGDGVNLLGPDTCHSYLVFGTLTITEIVTNNNGCKDTVAKPVSILPSPNAAFSLNDTIICSDQTLCITDLTTSNSSSIASWTWNYGGVFSSASPNPPCYQFNPPYQPTYEISLIVIDQSTCRDTAAILVTLNEVPTANFSWSTACESELMPLTSTSTQGDGALISCEWLFWVGSPSPTTSNNCNASYQFPAGSYPVQLIVRDINGCTDTIVKTVLSDSISQLLIYPGDTTICLGTSVQYNVSGIFDNITWTPNVWISDPNAASVLITPLANIGYIVSAVNGVCAAASDTFVIRTIQQIPIEVKATPDKVVLGLSSNITSQIGGQIDSITWYPDATLDCRECPNPIALPTQTTTYYATIYYSENGVTCTTIDSVTIEVLKVCDNSVVYVPNTFTPNGDGLNDIFMIRGLAATRIKYFRVFDRWGKLVHEALNGIPNDPTWGWNGTDRNGEKLNSAVYVYTYEIECINGDIVNGQGNVTLIR
jgi:gliding motility-associated-like protein